MATARVTRSRDGAALVLRMDDETADLVLWAVETKLAHLKEFYDDQPVTRRAGIRRAVRRARRLLRALERGA